MRIEVGGPIVVEIRDEVAYTDVIHLPAEERVYRGGRWRRRLDSYAWIPLEWRALCGLSGYVYVYNGPLRRRRFCLVCVERCNRDLGGVSVSDESRAPLRLAG